MEELRAFLPDRTNEELQELLNLYGSVNAVRTFFDPAFVAVDPVINDGGQQVMQQHPPNRPIVIQVDDDDDSTDDDNQLIINAQNHMNVQAFVENQNQNINFFFRPPPIGPPVIIPNNEIQNNQMPAPNWIDLRILGIECRIHNVRKSLYTTIKEVIRIVPGINLGRVSTYLSMINLDIEPTNFVDRIVMAANDPNTPISRDFYNNTDGFLASIFPMYTLASIKERLKTNQYMIIPTIKSFKDHQPPFMKRPRVRNNHFRSENPIIAVQLIIMNEEEEKKRKEREEIEEEARILKEAEETGAMYECECCFCECPFQKLVQCPEGHLFCVECTKRAIETAISEGRVNIQCLHFGGCDQSIPMAELERAIPPKLLQRLNQTETLNAIVGCEEIEGLVKCHNCGFMVVYDGEGPFVCPECKSKTCPKCGEEWHPDLTCEQMKEIDKSRLVEEKMNEAVVRTCPKCKTQFMKEEGCNKMECPRCHSWICYWCHQVIPKEVGYSHFWRESGICPPNRCPLWVDNSMLHKVEAERAKNENAVPEVEEIT